MISNDADPDIHATPHIKSEFGSTVATVSALQDHRGQRSVGQGRDEKRLDARALYDGIPTRFGLEKRRNRQSELPFPRFQCDVNNRA